MLLEEQDEMVYLGRALGVFRRADGTAGEGSSSLRELQVGNRRQNNVGYILSSYADSCLFRHIAGSQLHAKSTRTNALLRIRPFRRITNLRTRTYFRRISSVRLPF